ncbi:hypothetical protein F9802_02005 [Bacillus aerolatus]|uniref:YpoC-like domain-containing protein n=1 Tax=Bacillus aerolatus TaxID=2653354 RepID=A0A6I1FJQ2_9BACI|nr:hypothetical protein [Bacillus aerolatus]KAB7708939.1 hypothetical protein F9802_02005 [Bacillus aerolatus]
MEQTVTIPEWLKHPLFFQQEEVYLSARATVTAEPFFIYELAGEEQPWAGEEKGMFLIAAEWTKLKSVLEKKFRQRDKNVQAEMKAAAALFLMKLFWSNSAPVQLNGWQQNVKKFDIKPVNVEERLGFVLSELYSYHAYVQICELMIEQEKQAAKYCVLKKKQ